jgi:FAD binding domain
MTHEAKVQFIVRSLKQQSGTKLSLKKSSVSHLVPLLRTDNTEKIDISALTDIIAIDPVKKTAVAEAGATFADVVEATLKHGLVPYVVPELKTITLGGAINGCSIESMSYKVGGFHDTCLEYEIITALGEILVCSPNQHADIFNMVHGSFGTLGILSKITFKLCPAEPYVKTNYRIYKSVESLTEAIDIEYQDPKHDFMDGIIHGPGKFVLVLADFVSTTPWLNDYNGQKVFYRSTLKLSEDYMKTADYFFRYDRDCHWISRQYGLENPILRKLLGRKFLGSTNMIRTAKKYEKLLSHGKPLVTVDTMIGLSKFNRFYKWFEKEFNYFPIWVVPYKMPTVYPWFKPGFIDKSEQLYVDLAIYGMRQKGDKDYYQLLDDKLLEERGAKTLISLNRYSKDTFWKIYDHEAHLAVKKQVDPNGQFPDLYEKTHRAATKISG